MDEKSEYSLSITEEKNDEDNEEGEIVITSEEYKLRLKSIFTKLNEYLKKSKVSLRELFKQLIFKPTFEDPKIESNEDAILLTSFVDFLKTKNINLDTIDSYCLYMRLKIIENFEAISFNFLEHELKNIGNGNEMSATNTSKNNLNEKEIDNKSVDAKIEDSDVENENFKKKEKHEYSNKSNIDFEDRNNNNNIKEQLALIDSDSEKESMGQFEQSESKIDSNSSDMEKNEGINNF